MFVKIFKDLIKILKGYYKDPHKDPHKVLFKDPSFKDLTRIFQKVFSVC